MREEFLANYEADLCIETTLFPGIDAEMLDDLDARGVRWGIVTNKVARLTEPLVAQLGLDVRAGCVVSGDTTPHAKPHPAPLLHAARELDRDTGTHRLCRRRFARRAGGFRRRYENGGRRLRLLRQRHSADAVARAARGVLAGRSAEAATRHRLNHPAAWLTMTRLFATSRYRSRPSRQSIVKSVFAQTLGLARKGNEPRGRPGFDRGCKAARAYRGPVTSLINGKNVTANDETFALAA
jgi:hypothetical protein